MSGSAGASPPEGDKLACVLSFLAALAVLLFVGSQVDSTDNQKATGTSPVAASSALASSPTAPIVENPVPAPSSSPAPVAQPPPVPAPQQQLASSDSGVATAVGSPASGGTVTGIVDGDTVDVTTAEGLVRVRVLGVDSPEVHGAVECGGPDASAFATQTLLGKPVELLSDPTQERIDDHGRALRYVVQAGVNYSEAIADHGLAKSYIYGGVPVQAHPQILAAENRAKAARRGIWGGVVSCQNPQPPAALGFVQPRTQPQQAPQPAPQTVQPRTPKAPHVPMPAPKPKSESGSIFYKNCAAARAAGAAPVHRGEPGYASHLDRDGDGTGCDRG